MNVGRHGLEQHFRDCTENEGRNPEAKMARAWRVKTTECDAMNEEELGWRAMVKQVS